MSNIILPSLSRTGNRSREAALELLGFKTLRPNSFDDIFNNLETHIFTDTYSLVLIDNLITCQKITKVISCKRDKDSWLKSCESFLKYPRTFGTFWDKIRWLTYSTHVFDHELFSEAYDYWFRVLDSYDTLYLPFPHGWDELLECLDIKTKVNITYPHKND